MSVARRSPPGGTRSASSSYFSVLMFDRLMVLSVVSSIDCSDNSRLDSGSHVGERLDDLSKVLRRVLRVVRARRASDSRTASSARRCARRSRHRARGSRSSRRRGRRRAISFFDEPLELGVDAIEVELPDPRKCRRAPIAERAAVRASAVRLDDCRDVRAAERARTAEQERRRDRVEVGDASRSSVWTTAARAAETQPGDACRHRESRRGSRIERVEQCGERGLAFAAHGDVDVGWSREERLAVAVYFGVLGPPCIVRLAGFAYLSDRRERKIALDRSRCSSRRGRSLVVRSTRARCARQQGTAARSRSDP